MPGGEGHYNAGAAPPMPVMKRDIPGTQSFLPELCSARSVLLLTVGGELLALLLLLGTPEGPAVSGWASRLAYLSVFIQWTVLTSAGLLCLGRPVLNRLPVLLNTCCCFLLVSIMLTLVHYAASWADRILQGITWATENDPTLLFKRLGVAFITTGVTLRYLYLRNDLRLRVQATAQARIDALQARIRPHFLFNSLNTIMSLVHNAPQQAEQMLEDLSELFRGSIQNNRKQATLSEELELCRRYLRMEQSRLGERLRVHWELEELPQDLPLPPLLLQPLLENAVYHGIEPMSGGGEIRIRVRCRAQRLELLIENPVDEDTARGMTHGLRLAQENIHHRLEITYGSQASFRHGREADLYRAELVIPMHKPPA